MKKKIVFLTGTRADFGKLKSLIEITAQSKEFEPYIFVTGMHMNVKYGMTADEITKCGYRNTFYYYNHTNHDTMDIILSKTIQGFSQYVEGVNPDLIVIHGDRVEALAGAIVGALNDRLTAHIEGGELSGTVDEFIRHSVSKLCHIHFVSNAEARKRLIQMGEQKDSIFEIGSPDIDIMLSKRLPTLAKVKRYYDITFDKYSILMFHPVTTEFRDVPVQARNLVDAVLESNHNYIVIYPNNDKGSDRVFEEYRRFDHNPRIRLFPSTRFESFLVLLRHAQYIIGNSSAGIREAPYMGTPTVNIGTRQRNRSYHNEIIHCGYEKLDILSAVEKAVVLKRVKKKANHFGDGKSDQLFLKILKSDKIWKIPRQKQFNDIYPEDETLA